MNYDIDSKFMNICVHVSRMHRSARTKLMKQFNEILSSKYGIFVPNNGVESNKG